MKTGAKAYLAASIVSQVSALVRFVILSRLVGPEELGLVTILILTAQFFELVTDAASDRFMIQDPGGDEPRLQHVVQAAMVARGLLIGLGIAVTAPLVSSLFDAPGLTPALIALAVTPMIGGLVHTDVYRAQRAENFNPASRLIAISEIAGLVGTATAAFIVRDHTAILYGLILRAIAMVAVSHAVAERPYRWGYGQDEARRFIAFALPLFLNGLLLFLGTQGDRLVIGAIGTAELGRYSAVQLLIFYPTAIALRFMVNIHLPKLSASRDDPAAFSGNVERLAGRSALLFIVMAFGFAIVGPFVTPLLYGPAFVQAPLIFALLAMLQCTRTLRLWPTTVALSLGRSGIAAIDNGVRIIALPLAFLVSSQYPGITAILIAFAFGEIAALLVTLFLANRAASLGNPSGLLRIGLFLTACTAMVVGALAAQTGQGLLLATSGLVSLAALGGLAFKERLVLAEAATMARTFLKR